MSGIGIKFVPLPESLQKRVTKVMKKIENGEIDADWGSQLFMWYFAQRLSIIANNDPNSQKFHQAAKGKRLALVIKRTGIDHVATFGEKITEFTVEKGSKLSDPAMIFKNMDVFLDVILNRKDLMRAGMEKLVEVRKMANLFKWMAPIIALQNETTQKLLEEKCPVLLDKVITEIEEKTGI
ncbi:MAG: hypothetical protein ACTSRS_10680 [Candidatus Helarchaeota archaeon]